MEYRSFSLIRRRANDSRVPDQKPVAINWWPWLALGVALVAGLSKAKGAASGGGDVDKAIVSQAPPAPTIPGWVKWGAGGLGTAYLAWKGVELLDHIDTSQLTKLPVTPSPQGPTANYDGEIHLFPITSLTQERAEPAPIPAPPPDARYLQLAPHPSVVLTIGKRDAGKSTLNWRLLELYKDQAEPCVVGLPASARRLVPDWVGLVDCLEDAPHGSVVLMDESYLQYHARGSMTGAGRSIGALINLSRQKRQTLLFVVQEASQLDRNIASQIDALLIKELSELSEGYERPQIRRITDKARVAFQTVTGDRRKWTYVYSEAAGDVGLVENRLPTFWKPALSHAFANTGTDLTQGTPQKGTKTPREELKAKAEELMHVYGSYGKVAKVMGLPKSTVWDLINRN